jgi:hypothetical protein
MTSAKEPRKRKREGSLFESKGYWYFTYGYRVDGKPKKMKECLGST